MVPDVELLFAPSFFLEHGFGNPPGHGFTIGVVLLHPESRGSLTLRSANPADAPSIQPNYFLAAGCAGAARRAAPGAPDRPGESAGRLSRRQFLPGAAVQSDADLTEFLRERSETLYHPVGTCKMGEDPQAVVDPSLRVHGVEGLRVVDAAVIPTIISGHTNAPSIMIAEKAADLIKEQAAVTAGAAQSSSSAPGA